VKLGVAVPFQFRFESFNGSELMSLLGAFFVVILAFLQPCLSYGFGFFSLSFFSLADCVLRIVEVSPLVRSVGLLAVFVPLGFFFFRVGFFDCGSPV